MTVDTVDRPEDAGVARETGRRAALALFLFSPNAGKRAAEKYYAVVFLASVPFQALVTSRLSFEPGTSNDVLLSVRAW